MADPTDSAPRSGSVIHDLGYRAYTGPRESDRTIGLSLFVLGLRHVWGLGRIGRAKAAPFTLLAVSLLPAVAMVGSMTLIKSDMFVAGPLDYLNNTQLLSSIFVAMQAPVLFSRDLSSRSIVLYLARPLSSTGFVLARWGALVAALLIFLLAPLVLLTLGAFVGDGDGPAYLAELTKSLPLVLLTAMLLAGLAGVISAHALRRGFAVVGTIVVTIVLTGLVQGVQLAASENGSQTLGSLAGLFSPWTLVLGLAHTWGLADAGDNTPPEGVMVLVAVVFALLVVAGCLAILLRRFAQAGRR